MHNFLKFGAYVFHQKVECTAFQCRL